MPDPVAGGSIGRTDQGVDISGRPGAALTDPVPGTSRLAGRLANWFAGQPYYWFQVLSGPFRGKYWYVAEQADVTVPSGGQVSQGQQIGRYASSGTATEWGWATASGSTLARATTGYREGDVTPAGSQFRSQIIDAKGSSAVGTAATVNGWRVKASQESDGGQGACGPIGSGGMWFSELSTVPMGTGSDFAALGKLPCGTKLMIQNPANGKTVQAEKRDVGAGSSFLPVMGIYPATAAALGLSGGEYTVVIWRTDGGPLHPVRGTPTSASGSFGGTRPSGGGGAPADTGQAIEAILQTYQDEINLPRTAPASGFVSVKDAGIKAPFQWWLQSFLGKWQSEASPVGEVTSAITAAASRATTSSAGGGSGGPVTSARQAIALAQAAGYKVTTSPQLERESGRKIWSFDLPGSAKDVWVDANTGQVLTHS